MTSHAARPHWDDGEAYVRLAGLASHAAAEILDRGLPDDPSPVARYIAREAAACLAHHRASRDRSPELAGVRRALDVLREGWEALASGAVTGEELYEAGNGVWHGLMTGWPMSGYAARLADAVVPLLEPGDVVVEVGAGVGATTRALRSRLGLRASIRVMATDIAYEGRRHQDVTEPFTDHLIGADAVVATNVLHCVEDRDAALAHMVAAVRPGGMVAISEGAPETGGGAPWALNLLFGPLRGWHDRGGFVTAGTWDASCARAGLECVVHQPWRSGDRTFGGTWLGRRPK